MNTPFNVHLPFLTRDGNSVTFITTNSGAVYNGRPEPYVGFVNLPGGQYAVAWGVDGKVFGGQDHKWDLINTPQPNAPGVLCVTAKEEPTLDLSKPVQTKEKRPVRILCTDGPDITSPVVGFIEGNDRPDIWKLDGRWSGNPSNHRDLINTPPPALKEYSFVRYVPVYENSSRPGGCALGKPQLSLEEAREAYHGAGRRKLAIIELPIHFTEGQGL